MIEKVERYKISNGLTYETLEEAEFHEARNRLNDLCEQTMESCEDCGHEISQLSGHLADHAEAFEAALREYSLKKKAHAAALEKARLESEAAKPILKARPKRRG